MSFSPRIDATLTRQAIELKRIEAFVNDPAAGAVVTFVGTTRKNHLGKGVLHLEYDAHESIALKMLRGVCEDAAKKHTLVGAAVCHRLGRLEIGEASVFIAVSSAHRGAAFDGCRYIIDTLKTTVPIFKKEYYADGAPACWVGPDGKAVLI
jgi:molybdopterin synthase catalytic subunit